MRRGGRSDPVRNDTAPMLRVINTPSYKFSRMWDFGSLGKAGSDQGYAQSFQLSDLSNYTEFTNLFDRYRFPSVEIVLDLVVPNTAGSTQFWPTVLMWPDYDDATAPSSLNSSLEVMSAERLQFSNAVTQFRRSIVPHVDVAALQSGGTSAAALSAQTPWLDCGAPSIAHYGVKMWIKNYSTGISAIVNMSFRYHFETKEAR